MKSKKPCAPMRADEQNPRLKSYLKRCWCCGAYNDRRECMDVMVRLSHWLQSVPTGLLDRVRRVGR